MEVPHDVGLEQEDARVAIRGRTLGLQASTRQLRHEMEVGHDLGRLHQDAMRRLGLEVESSGKSDEGAPEARPGGGIR